jgi:hypothetical protein
LDGVRRQINESFAATRHHLAHCMLAQTRPVTTRFLAHVDPFFPHAVSEDRRPIAVYWGGCRTMEELLALHDSFVECYLGRPYSPTAGELFNPLLEAVTELRDHIRCFIALAITMLDDPERLFTVAEASVITGYKPETIRRWAARWNITSRWIEAVGEYRLTASVIRQIRESGPGPKGRFEPTIVAAPMDDEARVRKLKRHANGTGGADGVRS